MKKFRDASALPPLPTQRAIAERLDRADALRQKDRQLLQEYDALAEAVFVEMFGDPVRNEKGWEVKRINEVAITRLGKMLDAHKDFGTNKARYLGNSNVRWFSFDLENLKEMDFSEDERVILELKAGDILMCEGGEIGRCAVWNNEVKGVFYQKAIHRIRVNRARLEPLYFVWLMYFFSKYGGFKDYVTSVTIAHLTGEKLRSMKIPIPPLPLQTRFAALLANIERQKEIVRQQQVESEALFGRLLQEAFEGDTGSRR